MSLRLGVILWLRELRDGLAAVNLGEGGSQPWGGGPGRRVHLSASPRAWGTGFPRLFSFLHPSGPPAFPAGGGGRKAVT